MVFKTIKKLANAIILLMLTFLLIGCQEYSSLIIYSEGPIDKEEIKSVVNRTNKLANLLDLHTLKEYFVLEFKDSLDKREFQAAYLNTENRYSDTIHVYLNTSDNTSSSYDPDTKNILINKYEQESEKVFLHEFVHHRLDDKTNSFPHYRKAEPACSTDDRKYWCNNLMSYNYFPFSIMLADSQYVTIQQGKVMPSSHYCHQRNTYPKDDNYLKYQDTIACCSDFKYPPNCDDFKEFVDTITYDNPEEIIKLCISVDSLLKDLHYYSIDAFCSRYLSVGVINRLRMLIVEKSFHIDYPDGKVQENIISDSLGIPLVFERPAGMEDSTIINSFVDFYFASQLDNKKINRLARAEAEYFSDIYREPAQEIYSRNMGLYQKDLIMSANEYYTEENINFSFDKKEMKYIFINYSSFPELETKGIQYKGIELHLSKEDLANLISQLP